MDELFSEEKSVVSSAFPFPLEILSVLLIDRTTGKNIIWATDDYSEFGIGKKSQIELEQICGANAKINLIPRCQKQKKTQAERTKERAEVFTPSWICNEMNNMVDEEWFGRANVFNSSDSENPKKWISTTEKIVFDTNIESGKTWQDYVKSTRLEITCGEAPYLTSRYDTVTGENIKIAERIGLLDRKMRVVCENTQSEAEYFLWTEIAFQNCYGYELQGDSLLLARSNFFMAFIENTNHHLKRNPTKDEQMKIAEIISWNLWQMDGLTFRIPYEKGDDNKVASKSQPSLFEEFNQEDKTLALIYDWGENKPITFKSLYREGKNE